MDCTLSSEYIFWIRVIFSPVENNSVDNQDFLVFSLGWVKILLGTIMTIGNTGWYSVWDIQNEFINSFKFSQIFPIFLIWSNYINTIEFSRQIRTYIEYVYTPYISHLRCNHGLAKLATMLSFLLIERTHLHLHPLEISYLFPLMLNATCCKEINQLILVFFLICWTDETCTLCHVETNYQQTFFSFLYSWS
jgi:hypothetical protein